MNAHFHELSPEEQKLLHQAPLLVSILIAGADGKIDTDEKHRVLEVVHTKTFSEKNELSEFYKELNMTAEKDLRTLIAALPDDTEERNTMISDLLSGLNPILKKLESNLALRFYKNLREFANYIATADGGFWGIGSVSAEEKAWVKLPMIENPAAESNA